MYKEYTVETLRRELGMYENKCVVKIMDNNEVELDIDFVDYDDRVGIVYVKGYLM